MSTWQVALAIGAVVLSGLISGQMLAIGLANQAVRSLPETSWTLRFQAENTLFSKTMPPAVLLPLLGLVSMVFVSASQQRLSFVVAATLEAVVLVITVALNIPINREVQSWQAGSAPPVWMAVRDRWLLFHWLRTAVGVGAFAAAVFGLSFQHI
jgi:uncharacterized membrane protein